MFAREISEEKEPDYFSSEVSENELLRIISLIDQVEIDGVAYAISLDGTWFDDEEFTRPEAAEFKNILTRATESKPDE